MEKKSENKKIEKTQNLWHLKTADEVLKELKSSRSGLSHSEAKDRLAKSGENKLSSEKKFRWHKVLFGKLNSILIYILFGAALVAFISHEVLEFVIIMIIIVLTVMLGFFQEYKADRTVKALSKLTAKKVVVLRDGKKKEINATELVIGDIVYLKRGDIVPSDLRLLEVSGLAINESILTGESLEKSKISDHIEKENITLGDMKNIAFGSTFVTSGSGVGVVIETGLNTFIGKISTSLENIKDEKSPIAKKVDLMSKRISYIVLSAAFFLFVVLLVKGNSLYFSLLFVSAVAISGIPESFPLALTMTFSNGIKNMAKQNAIVKDLNSVETLGTTTVICTDKTGTLTENKMRVAKISIPKGEIYEVRGSGYDPNNTFYVDNKIIEKSKVSISSEFMRTAILCNEAEVLFDGNMWKLSGEPTEGALLTLAKSLDFDENVIKENNKRVFVMPFDPLKKFMISVNKNAKERNSYDFYLKGAGEIVLAKCSYYRDSKGKISHMTPSAHKEIIANIEEFNSKGLRVLSLASKKVRGVTQNEKKFIEGHLDKGYVFEGIVGIEDPIREEVYEAVSQCHKAGIKIVMITGDHKLIAKNIGEKLGLFTHTATKIIEGFEIDKLNDKELDDVISNVAIFARTTPEHKLRIVNSFQRKGEIVAMTGDGVNDAPALKKADIGISMGKNGTEVAREASNMVLTDDNFATIVKAVKEGRTVYSNVRRFIYYFLTGNFTEVALIIMAVLIGLPLPLTALMILFVNIVTSTIPALALSVEPTHDKVMKQKPRDPKERLLSAYLLTKVAVLIPFLLFGTLGIFIWELYIGGEDLAKAMTLAFATMISFELFHAFNSRRLHTTIFGKGFFANPHIFSAVGSSFALMLLAIYTPFGQMIFSTVPLAFSDWIAIIVISSLVIVFTEIIKLSIKAEFKEQSTLQGVSISLE